MHYYNDDYTSYVESMLIAHKWAAFAHMEKLIEGDWAYTLGEMSINLSAYYSMDSAFDHMEQYQDDQAWYDYHESGQADYEDSPQEEIMDWEEEYEMFLLSEEEVSDHYWESAQTRFADVKEDLSKGDRYSKRKTKRNKDYCVSRYNAGRTSCGWELSFKYHRHYKAMPILETEEDKWLEEQDEMLDWFYDESDDYNFYEEKWRDLIGLDGEVIPYERSMPMMEEMDRVEYWHMCEPDWCSVCNTDLYDCSCGEDY